MIIIKLGFQPDGSQVYFYSLSAFRILLDLLTMFKIQRAVTFILFSFLLFQFSYAETSRSSYFIPKSITDGSIQDSSAILLANQARDSFYGLVSPIATESLAQCLLKGKSIIHCINRQCPSQEQSCLNQRQFETRLILFLSVLFPLATTVFLFPKIINGCLILFSLYLIPLMQKIRLRLKQHTSRHTLEDIFCTQNTPVIKKIRIKIKKSVFIKILAVMIYGCIFYVCPNENIYFFFGRFIGILLALTGGSYLIALVSTPKKENRPTVANTIFWILLIINSVQKIYEGL